MIKINNQECLIIKHYLQGDGDLFVVFFVRGSGFLKGILKAEMRRFVGEIRLFHYAQVSYFDLQNGNGLMAISELKMREKADAGETAF